MDVTLASLHIYAETPTKHGLEIVVRSSEEAGKKRKCEIFRRRNERFKDQELEKVLKDKPDPTIHPIIEFWAKSVFPSKKNIKNYIQYYIFNSN